MQDRDAATATGEPRGGSEPRAASSWRRDLLRPSLRSMSDLLCLFLDGDAPDAWAASYGPAASAAAADAAASKKPVTFYPQSGPRRVAVVPLPEAQSGAEQWRWAAAEAAKLAGALKAETVTLEAPDEAATLPLAEGFTLGAYRFDRYRTGEEAPAPPRLSVRVSGRDEEADVSDALALATATNAARDLVNLSPDEKMPADLAEAMREGAEGAGLRVEVWKRKRIEREGWAACSPLTAGASTLLVSWSSSTRRRARKATGPWCSWARASPTTPAASRSSPPRARWSS